MQLQSSHIRCVVTNIHYTVALSRLTFHLFLDCTRFKFQDSMRQLRSDVHDQSWLCVCLYFSFLVCSRLCSDLFWYDIIVMWYRDLGYILTFIISLLIALRSNSILRIILTHCPVLVTCCAREYFTSYHNRLQIFMIVVILFPHFHTACTHQFLAHALRLQFVRNCSKCSKVPVLIVHTFIP